MAGVWRWWRAGYYRLAGSATIILDRTKHVGDDSFFGSCLVTTKHLASSPDQPSPFTAAQRCSLWMHTVLGCSVKVAAVDGHIYTPTQQSVDAVTAANIGSYFVALLHLKVIYRDK